MGVKMIIKQENTFGKPSTVGELIEMLQHLGRPDLPVQFDDLGLPVDLVHVVGEPEGGEIHEHTEWVEIRDGERNRL